MNQIVACIDGSPLSTAVCDASCWAAKRLGAPLTLLHALDENQNGNARDLSGTLGVDSAQHLLEEIVELEKQRNRIALQHGKQLLQQFRDYASQSGVQEVQQIQRHGDVLESLKEREQDTRLFVIGRAGQGHENDLNAVGSHVESVVRAVNRPVLISVGNFTPPSNFMIAYDGRENMQGAIERTAQSALFKDLPCHLVMVGDDTPERQNKLSQAAELLRNAGFNVTTNLLYGEIYPALQQYQAEHGIEMTAIGAYAHSRVRRFFIGSNTTRMIAGSKVPVLVLK